MTPEILAEKLKQASNDYWSAVGRWARVRKIIWDKLPEPRDTEESTHRLTTLALQELRYTQAETKRRLADHEAGRTSWAENRA